VAGRSGHAQATPPANWYAVATTTVEKNQSKTCGGSRYYLTIPPGAMPRNDTVTIMEYDPDVLDFELMPDGIQFNRTVTICLDYEGTRFDPDTPGHVKGALELRWLNPDTGSWEPVMGSDSPLEKKFYGRLSHFSRYGLFTISSKAGWSPRRGTKLF
jgi:hypothetical protein